jgi:putative transposase
MPGHHPPHIYLNNTWYFITASLHCKQHLLRPVGHKDIVRDQLKTLIAEFHVQLAAWVILDNHYHILGRSRVGQDLSRLFGRLHGRTAFELNGRDGRRGRQVWHNYWDTCIRMEGWRFSSYCYYRDHKGNDWLMDAFERYLIVDFTDPDDDF